MGWCSSNKKAYEDKEISKNPLDAAGLKWRRGKMSLWLEIALTHKEVLFTGH